MDQLLDRIPCGYLTFNDEGVIREVNERFCEMIGCSMEKLAGQSVESVFTPGSGVFYQTHLYPLLKLKNRVEEVYLSMKSASGKKIPVLINALRSEENGVFLNRCIIVQLQRRSEYVNQILHAKKQAEEISKSKEKFLSMMSHELRTPLQVIISLVELLSEELNGDALSDEAEYLGMIKHAGKDLNRLIDDFLNFARLETGYFDVNTEVVVLEESVIRAVMMMLPKAEMKKIKINRCEKTDVKVMADPDRLQQILMNLLTNAIKFTDEGGWISISTRTEDAFVYIDVTDTGIGIPSDQQEIIFSPFMQVQTESAGKGSGYGLGLAICRQLAALMEGDLTVQSKPGKGSTFTLSLPLSGSKRTGS